MKSNSGKELARILEKQGWTLKKISGSHHIYTKDRKMERISIPVHGNKSLKLGLQVYLLKLADLNEKDLI